LRPGFQVDTVRLSSNQVSSPTTRPRIFVTPSALSWLTKVSKDDVVTCRRFFWKVGNERLGSP